MKATGYWRKWLENAKEGRKSGIYHFCHHKAQTLRRRCAIGVLEILLLQIVHGGDHSHFLGMTTIDTPPQFGTSGTVTHWLPINTPLIWNIRVCDTVLMIGLLCVEILIRVSMGVSKLAKPVCCWCEMTSAKSHFAYFAYRWIKDNQLINNLIFFLKIQMQQIWCQWILNICRIL